MAKTKSKVKFDFKDFLLKKGEYLAMGIAGFFLFLLMLWAIGKASNAEDPAKVHKELTQKATSVQNQVNSDQVSETAKTDAEVPQWVDGVGFKPVPVSAFLLTNPQFDPIAKPDTKKENPHVLPMGMYQVDLIRGSMRGFDIIQGADGEQMIAVIYSKKVDPQDLKKINDLASKIRLRGGKKGKQKTQPKAPSPMGFQPPGTRQPGGGFGGPGGEGPGGAGLGGGDDGGRNPYGGSGGFQYGGQRVEKAVEYVPIAQLDAAMKKQKVPAMTVIPVRMVTVHAEIPLKNQIEEFRRSLRLTSKEEAARWGPIYDGFKVKRRVTSMQPNGEEMVIQDWADYDFESMYQERIRSLRAGDHLDEGYLGYFYRYEMNLALPLPELVTETGAAYPNIRLKSTLDTIKKLEEAAKGKEEPSEIFKRVNKKTPRESLYLPQSPESTGAAGAFGDAMTGQNYGDLATGAPTSGVSKSAPGPYNPYDSGYNPNIAAPVDIDHLLLRFLDPAVEPGLTYQYQIQLVMRNPNFGHKKDVSKPADADKEFLYSPWVQTDAIPVPAETFLFATDWDGYTRKIKEEYDREPILRQRLEAQPHQAVVETLTWMEQVRTGDGGKREPVGAWVVAEYPVGRGEYIGRKQYVKLPLWSSETMSYVLREIPDRVIPKVGTKDPPQPKGWLMDFTNNKSILVDYEGGKARTRIGTKEASDEVATEMLVLRGDGKLVVKRSTDSETDKDRKEIVSRWEKWLSEVIARRDLSSEGPGGFSPRPPGPGNP